MQKVCITPHPQEDRPCSTRYAHTLEVCPQCRGVAAVEEHEYEQLMADIEEKPKAAKTSGRKVQDNPQA